MMTADHFAPFDLPPDAVQWLLDLWHCIQVLDDVADGLVSPEAAARIYGVVIGPDGQLDTAATEVARAR
jgi:hypothetical protein